MEQSYKCERHGEVKNIFCETCDLLVCYECLDLHAKKGCKQPTSLFSYTSEKLLRKYEIEIAKIEREKDSLEKLVSYFVTSFKDMRPQLMKLKEKLNSLLANIETFESLPNTIDKLMHYPSMVKEELTEDYSDLKEAIASKNIDFIMKKMRKLNLKQVFKMGDSNQQLIEAVSQAMNAIANSKDIDMVVNGIQEIYTTYKTLLEDRGGRILSKYLYGVIEPEADFELLCKFDTEKKEMIPTVAVRRKSTTTQIGSRVFISGGYNPEVDEVSEFIESDQSLVARRPMNYAKALHTTQVISLDAFVTVGGKKGGSKSFCEEYSIAKNEWTILPSLNNARYGAATVLLENKYLYAIGGYSSKNTIERLDLTQKKAWIVVDLASNDLALHYSPKAFPISDDRAIILRGEDTSEVGVFNATSGTIRKSKLLSAKEYFYYTNVCSIKSRMYILGYYGNVVSYNTLSRRLEVIPYSAISTPKFSRSSCHHQ